MRVIALQRCLSHESRLGRTPSETSLCNFIRQSNALLIGKIVQVLIELNGTERDIYIYI